ncbi:hypothetical protein C8R46DRAFT_1217726 [Mycena filopes]|nr:hypothetical protein C8R46DRAFT_1217726 [Mycena filopes]
MNRPRPSVLALFDPLTARDAHSPDSDKENTLPDSDFFAQTHVQYYSPVRLTRRLVEVGDVTVEVGEDADEEEDEHAHEHDATFSEPPSVVVCPPEDTDTTIRAPLAIPKASGLYCHPLPRDPDGQPHRRYDYGVPPHSIRGIALAASKSPPSSVFRFDPSDDDAVVRVDDRSSADLQTSFALHMNMNSDDTSFDLLTDRISFRGYADEESFDMGERLGAISEQEDDEAPPLSTSSVPPPVFVAPPSRQTPPLPVLSTRLPEPPALIPALKIVKRKHPDTAAVTNRLLRFRVLEEYRLRLKPPRLLPLHLLLLRKRSPKSLKALLRPHSD